MANFNNNEQTSPGAFTLSSTLPPAMSSFFASHFPASAIDPSTTQPVPTPAPEVSNTATVPSSTPTSATTKGSSEVRSSSISPSSSSSHRISAVGAESTNTSSGSASSPTGSTLSTTFTSPVTPAAAATSGSSAIFSEAKQCSGISCSPGLQAAVAVPITLIGLGLIIAFFILARRRRRRDSSSAASNEEPRGSKWARHLRVFSFDAELLIGGRSSASGSVRSPSVRSHPTASLRSQRPSMRSLESPAPPYRDALAAPGVQMSERPESSLTAPPPYIANRASHRPMSRLSAISRPAIAASNPFADPEDDDEPTSPVSQRSIGRLSLSPYTPLGADDFSFMSSEGDNPSEAGSIQQAEVARRVSGARQS